MKLVIVESPAKCKKIEEYLGEGYKCIATYGHLREIGSIQNIDISNHFCPTYSLIDNPLKKKQIQVLKREIKNADEVILALDNDREGSGIAYGVMELFNLPKDTKRITFNEITETALHNAVNCPSTIDMDLVRAQQARQIMDILVGYKVSPVLWKCITSPKGKDHSLSAGRCQTPALQLIYDNDKEIQSCKPVQVYKTTGYFTSLNLPFILSKEFVTEDEMKMFLNGSKDFQHVYSCSLPVKVTRKQPEPFTTSRIQQEASNAHHYSPKETMRICQTLYEGGFITYMRTESKTYSGEFIETAKKYIRETYTDYTGQDYTNTDKYIGSHIDKLVALSEEAHEAIRPTNLSLYSLPERMDTKEQRIYRLIWDNTVESCMPPAIYNSITATVTAFQGIQFTYKSEQVSFPGWKIVTIKSIKSIKGVKDNDLNKEYSYLQNVKQGEIQCKKMTSRAGVTGGKLHYTEARLVQLLEEKGIGRPSTFSSLVDKIQERGYVKKEDVKGREAVCKEFELERGTILETETKREFGNEKNKLVLQPLGAIVTEFLGKHFSDLFEYDYTQQMEDELDLVASGRKVWHELCKECNDQIDRLVASMGNLKKLKIQIDENNTYLIGKYGPVIKCVEEKEDGTKETTFKKARNDIYIDKLENYEGDPMELIEKVDETDEKQDNRFVNIGTHEGKDVFLSKGRYGLYMKWGDTFKSLKEFGNRPIENIHFEEVKKYLEESSSSYVRVLDDNTSIRKGPRGDYLFHKTGRMKKPKFYEIKSFAKDTNEDYKICDLNILQSWVKEKYKLP